MYATSEVEANEWVQILDWRLKQVCNYGDEGGHLTPM